MKEENEMFVFIDESGNTGQNIADKSKPIFYHLAILSKYNLDLDLKNRIGNFLQSHKQKELHATENPKMLEELSPIILQVLKENNVSFYYAEIEKSLLAYAKLYDTIFDNVENLGARWTAYQFRPLRLMLLCNLIGIIDENIAFDFYKNCLMANSQQQADEYLKRTCKLILAETYKLKDYRSKQIIEDAVNGAKYFSSDITMFEKCKQDRWRHLPHIVSFWPMLSAISIYSNKHNLKVHRIIHDEQEQIHRVISEMHEVAAKTGKTGTIWDLKENGALDFTKIPENSFEMKDSTKSYGIQITDVCLYVLTHDEPDSFFEPHKYELYNYINKHLIDRFIFSKKMLYFEASLWYNKIMNANLSQDQIEFGKDFVKKMDDKFYEDYQTIRR
ncbi:MAG: DUF3800 domain-containing protein [Treponema sp.]|nr:DUF3800 domain-containing protein [Treponema sp.]